ncbi:TMEM175 family protein [Pseudonocardia sp. N23]|uniref:TMEM175 family protein n=1 Tax=Pseudonocardia sp. N23 TaxID=1987376 RepID=UPI000BFB323B|nr:TMEM175 family protein [Pseudonocardia sp. N23]GAY09561.1 protein of unknown function DUF1211 [Pseudonocardia sp. N23]
MTSEGAAEPTAEARAEAGIGAAAHAAAETGRRTTIAAEIARSAAERLAFFSDAVVAIAITLLAIELPVPEGDTDTQFLHSLGEESFAYITFLISFVAIANHWAAHHRVFRYVGRADRPLVLLNLVWLLLIVLTPFLTEVIREGDDITWIRFGLYSLAQALLLFVLAVMVSRMSTRDLFVEGTPGSLSRRGWISMALTGAGFLLSIPFFPLLHAWSFAVWIVLPIVFNRIAVAVGLVPPHRRGEDG